MNKIYVASSWRNTIYPTVIEILKADGYNVYDFRNPAEGNKGFHWSEIDLYWKEWTPEGYRKHLNHPIAESGFMYDFEAMKECSIFIGVAPFGRSASLEMGWAAGQGKKTILLLHDGEPELMVKILDHICVHISEVLTILEENENG